MSSVEGGVCETGDPIDSQYKCPNCFHKYKIMFCRDRALKVVGFPTCPKCADYCSKCEKLCFRSELYPTADWDVCPNCL